MKSEKKASGGFFKKKIPANAIKANLSEQAPNNSYDPPQYYEDQPFTCVDCGKKDVWTAAQQKKYFEVWKRPIYGRAVRCKECREKHREHRRVSIEGMSKKRNSQPPAEDRRLEDKAKSQR